MALSLGVSRGSRVTIGQTVFRVLEIPHTQRLQLQGGDQTFEITDKQRTEVLPDVFISIGRSPSANEHSNPLSARLAIEAPRSIQITRHQ